MRARSWAERLFDLSLWLGTLWLALLGDVDPEIVAVIALVCFVGSILCFFHPGREEKI